MKSVLGFNPNLTASITFAPGARSLDSGQYNAIQLTFEGDDALKLNTAYSVGGDGNAAVAFQLNKVALQDGEAIQCVECLCRVAVPKDEFDLAFDELKRLANQLGGGKALDLMMTFASGADFQDRCSELEATPANSILSGSFNPCILFVEPTVDDEKTYRILVTLPVVKNDGEDASMHIFIEGDLETLFAVDAFVKCLWSGLPDASLKLV